MLQFLFVSVVVVIAVSVRASVIFEDCGSEYELERVHIEGCARRVPCYVTLGENISVNIEFTTDDAPFRLDQEVVINVNFVDLEAPVSPDPCDMRQCPVMTGFVTSFMSIMSVPRDIALNQRGWLHWRVYNERFRLVVCFSVMVQTESLLQKLIRERLQGLFPQNSVEDYNQIELKRFATDDAGRESGDDADDMKNVVLEINPPPTNT